MKYKRTILALSLFIITFVYLIHPYRESQNTNSFKENIIRFHIKANSDMEKDQELKIKIRDKILEEMGEKFKYSKSTKETRNIIEENLEEIKNIAENIISQEGKDYSVDISLANKNFPTRKYGNITFPAGEYESLTVSIGEGKGKNWWCVMFPPLCFVDINHSNTATVEKDLQKILTEEEIEILLSNKKTDIVLKSRIAEILEKTKVYFAQFFAKN